MFWHAKKVCALKMWCIGIGPNWGVVVVLVSIVPLAADGAVDAVTTLYVFYIDKPCMHYCHWQWMIILFYRDSSHRNNKKISFSHPKSVPNLYVLTVAIDFHSMEKNTTKWLLSTVWLPTFLYRFNSYKLILVWINIRVSKWWNNFLFWVKYDG